MKESEIQSLRLLRDGFMNQLATYIASDDRTTEILHQLVSEFVDENIPIVDEDLRYELALMMMEKININTWE